MQNSNKPIRMCYIKTLYQNKKEQFKFGEHLIHLFRKNIHTQLWKAAILRAVLTGVQFGLSW